MQTPLLSVCIPTYTRAHHLKNALESILHQLKDSPNLVPLIEVVVSDNASTDNTSEIVTHYKNLIPNFVYSRNNQNIGFDLNTLNAVKHATGTYCWYLGDDDTIVNGALKTVVEICKVHTPDIGGTNLEALTGKSDWKKVRTYSPDDIIVMNDFKQYYYNGYCQGTLSALLFRRDKWLEVVPHKNFIEGWLYYETVLRLLGRSKKQFFVKKPTVMAGADCRWAENGGELFTYLNSNTIRRRMLTWGFDTSYIKDELLRSEQQILIFLLRAKGHGLRCTLANLRFMWINMYNLSPIKIFLALLIFITPNSFVRLVRDSLKRMKSAL